MSAELKKLRKEYEEWKRRLFIDQSLYNCRKDPPFDLPSTQIFLEIFTERKNELLSILSRYQLAQPFSEKPDRDFVDKGIKDQEDMEGALTAMKDLVAALQLPPS